MSVSLKADGGIFVSAQSDPKVEVIEISDDGLRNEDDHSIHSPTEDYSWTFSDCSPDSRNYDAENSRSELASVVESAMTILSKIRHKDTKVINSVFRPV